MTVQTLENNSREIKTLTKIDLFKILKIMKRKEVIYQYLPLSGIRPIPSLSKCLSNSSTHLSRLSL